MGGYFSTQHEIKTRRNASPCDFAVFLTPSAEEILFPLHVLTIIWDNFCHLNTTKLDASDIAIYFVGFLYEKALFFDRIL